MMMGDTDITYIARGDTTSLGYYALSGLACSALKGRHLPTMGAAHWIYELQGRHLPTMCATHQP